MRYGGTSGNTQGDKKLNSPARNAAAMVTSAVMAPTCASPAASASRLTARSAISKSGKPFCERLHGGVIVPRNLITDVSGVTVGHAQDAHIATGTTVIVFDEPAVAAVDVRGGGPGTREVDLLDPAMTVDRIEAIVLSGGSAFGLDAASGVQAYMREHGRGYVVGAARVPIVPGAILFDLLNGGDKDWGLYPPYRELAYAATASAAADFALGSVGAGAGATTVNFKGGIGSASAVTADGIAIGRSEEH